MTQIDVDVDGLGGVFEALDDLEEMAQTTTEWVVGTAVEYGIYLEFGTRHMDPKPFFRPALAEVRMQGVDGFIAHNTRTSVDDIDSVQELVQALAFALERRVKEIITKKDLIDTGTLRWSIGAVPISKVGKFPTEADAPEDPKTVGGWSQSMQTEVGA